MKRNLRFIEDPGHGWLEVEKTDITTLKIASKISGYSYKNKSMVYLEEDCDAALYMNAAKAAGWDVALTFVHQENTFIRNLPYYC